MPHQVLIDLGKLKTIYSGLGQFSLKYGQYISKISHAGLNWNFLVPGQFKGFFGDHPRYEKTSFARKVLPLFYQNYDIWHAVHQDSSFFPSNQKSAYILTIHDLNFLEEKHGFKVKRRLKKLQGKVNRACYVTFISKYTAFIANKNLDLRNKPQKVIYNGIDIDVGKKARRPAYIPEGPFLFTIGMVLKKKNFHVLVDFLERVPEYNLIIAGDKNSRYARHLQTSIKQKNLSKRIGLPGIISEEDKIFLYRHCEAFLFPSLIEGFGLPVIEAMRFGKPVFCSRRSSLPEIGGDCAFYWDSFKPELMKETFIESLKFFKENIDEFSRRNRNHSLKYNWDESIRQYLKVYDEVVQIQNKTSLNDLQSLSISSNRINFETVKESNKTYRNFRILHISSERTWKGGEQQIAYLIEEMNKMGLKNYVVCRKNSAFKKYCQNKNLDFYSLNFDISHLLFTASSISKICKKNKIDIIHMHSSGGHTVGLISTFFNHQAHLVLSRRVDNPIKSKKFSIWKYNHSRIKKIITVSKTVKRIIAEKIIDKSKCITIYDGIDIHKFTDINGTNRLRTKYHIPPEKILIGNTSALADHKDYFTFIDTADFLLQTGLNASFLIIGEGPERKKIESYLTSKKLTGEIILTGFIQNIPEILPELDIFLMTSKTEGLGSSILDAFACGVPVVATRAGGIPEIVIHESTGLLSPVKDYVDLGKNILRLLNDLNLKRKLTGNAKKWVQEHFSKEKTARETLKVYAEILSKKNGG